MPKKGNIMFNKFKHLIIAIIIVIFIIILDIIFENYSKISIGKINSNINEISEQFEGEEESYDSKKLEMLANKAKREWRKRQEILSCFIEHDEIEKINSKLDVLYVQIKNKVWGDAKTTVAESKELIRYLDGKYKLSIQNIF